MKNYHYSDKGLLIFLMRCAAMTGQTVPLETDQSLVSLCPFNHSILGLLALCSSTELGQQLEVTLCDVNFMLRLGQE